MKYGYCRCVCVVTLLEEYLRRTEKLREKGTWASDLLCVPPPICGYGKWLKTVLAECRIHRLYGAHSTRGAASSKALFVRVPIDTIMKAAGWSAQSTFAKHYCKPIR